MYGYKRENLHINRPWELKVKKLNQAGKIHVNLSLKFKGRIAQKRSWYSKFEELIPYFLKNAPKCLFKWRLKGGVLIRRRALNRGGGGLIIRL